MRPKALIVTRNLPPLTGGMERLNWHLVRELSKAFEVFVCGPEGCQEYMSADLHISATFASRPAARFLVQSLYRSIMAARRIRPDLLIAGSGVTAPHIVLAGHHINVPTLVYLHGLDLIADHLFYRRGFLPCIRRCHAIMTNSHNTARLALQVGIQQRRIHILHPGTDLPVDSAQIDATAFRATIAAGDRPILLSVGRLTLRKGLREFIRYVLPRIVVTRPEALLVVVGGEAEQKLAGSSRGFGDAIQQEAATQGLTSHVRLLGRVDDAILAQAYRASQLHVFPVLNLPGDVEGFGMVALEAAAYGLPTIAFNVGGVADAVAQGQSGLLIPPNDYMVMARAITNYLDGHYPGITAQTCRRFAEQLTWNNFGGRLLAICHDLIAVPVETG